MKTTNRLNPLTMKLSVLAAIMCFSPWGSAAEKPGEEKKDASLPTLVELGSTRCVACKRMEPVMEALRKEHGSRLNVVFIDALKDPAGAKKYKIRLIPTQVFLAPDGKEIARHQGYYSKEAILKKFKEKGFDLAKAEGEGV